MTGARATSGGDGPRGGRLVRSCRWLEACGLGPFKSSRRGRRRSRRVRATSGVDGPRGADWGDRVGGLKGVAWWPITKTGVSDPSYKKTPGNADVSSAGLFTPPPSAVILFSSHLVSSFSSQIAVFCFLLSTFRFLLPSPRLRSPTHRIFL
jgi:hypothetical protein